MMASNIPSDGELLRLMIGGDEEAFAQLYQRRQRSIYHFALRMSGSVTIAEDVTQEVFLALMREAHHFDAGRGELSSYLYGIARNQVLRRLDRERSYVLMIDEPENSDTPVHAQFIVHCDPLGDLTRHETIASVRQAVLALPLHYREVIVLCDLQEMSYAEVASALGCAIGTVRSRLHRGRLLLVEKLRTREEGKDSTQDAASDPVNSARCFA